MNFMLFTYLFNTFLYCCVTGSVNNSTEETNSFQDQQNINFLIDEVSVRNGETVKNIDVSVQNGKTVKNIDVSVQNGETAKNIDVSVQNGETVKHFFLFNKNYKEGNDYQILNPNNISTIKNSLFGSGKTYFIVHGFLGNGLESWILELKDKLLIREDCNVVSVDWPSGTEWYLPSYITAAHRVPTVGSDTADLMQILIDHKGLLLSNVHMIGHSLGAHICGFAGKKFEGRIAKITGLDPAGPYFRDVSRRKRLDKSDAVFVDVIHTNACAAWSFVDCYGITEDIGHVNFWPNGGAHQPFCSATMRMVKGSIGCNHEIAYTYFIESLDYDAKSDYFLARRCNHWYDFLDGTCRCGNAAQYMGINSNANSAGRFYLKTYAHRPFAVKDNGCTFKKSFLALSVFFIGGGILTVICSVGVICMFKKINRRYPHVNHANQCIRHPSANERTPLIS